MRVCGWHSPGPPQYGVGEEAVRQVLLEGSGGVRPVGSGAIGPARSGNFGDTKQLLDAAQKKRRGSACATAAPTLSPVLPDRGYRQKRAGPCRGRVTARLRKA